MSNSDKRFVAMCVGIASLVTLVVSTLVIISDWRTILVSGAGLVIGFLVLNGFMAALDWVSHKVWPSEKER